MQLQPIKQLLIFAELQVIHGAHTKWKQIAMVKESLRFWGCAVYPHLRNRRHGDELGDGKGREEG